MKNSRWFQTALPIVLIGVALAASARSQTSPSALQSVTCSGGVVGFLGTSGTVQIFDGPTQVATASATPTFTWTIPAAMQDNKFHVISVTSGGAELANSPQSFTCTGTASPYTPQVNYTSFAAVPSGTAWSSNGSGAMGVNGGLLVASSPGSLIYNTAIVPANSAESNQYEYKINTAISLNPALTGGTSNGNYLHYIYGSTTALQTSVGASPAGTGTYHAVELHNPTFDDVGNCSATLNSWEKTGSTPVLQGSITVPCGPSVRMRTVVFKDVGSGVLKVWTLLDNTLYSNGTSAATGQPGVGMIGVSASGAGIALLSIGPRSLIGPAPIGQAVAPNPNPATVYTSVFPTQVNIHWQEPQDTTGVGVIQHYIVRTQGSTPSGTGWATLSTDFSDDSSGLTAGTNYVYAVSERSFHGIFGPQTNIYVTTPGTNAIDPRRIGVRSTGSYWGAMGESIDTLSGNLNFSIPLLNAQGRNGWSVPFRLSYNSQNWRQDTQSGNSNVTYNWNLGDDNGYGYGWTLQLGSIVPYWSSTYGQVDHYVFTDSTGAVYNLSNVSGTSL